jgi:hypothetical protein
MRKGIIRALFAVAALALATPSLGAAQDAAQESGEISTTSSSGGGSSRSGTYGPLRVYGGIHFGGGGNLRGKINGHSDSIGMKGLFGGQFGGEYELHKYVLLGAEMRFTTTKADHADDRTFLWDIFSIKPKGRYMFSSIPLEVYGTTPFGLSLVAPHNNLDTKVNAHFGLGGGATYFFTDKMGVNAEILGMWHWFREKVPSFAGSDDHIRYRIGQFYMFLNFVYAL